MELLKDYYSEKIWLAPPQLYEISRLFSPGFGDFDAVRDFATRREEKSVERYLPVRIGCTNGAISVLPGNTISLQFR